MKIELNNTITKNSPSYEEARTMWNRAIQKYPLAFTYCKDKEDVRKSILWAKEKEIPIRIRSGGHHYDGFSMANDALVIDVSEMKGITIDEKNKTVTIEGGVRNRELYEFLGSRGYPFPGGGCPTVGVVGFALGGGWGYSGRFLGLGCDSILEVELINHEGELIVASETENKDLLWALKGSGGGNFGVVVSMTFKLPEKRSEATLIRLEYSDATREEKIKMFTLWQETIEKLCPEVNFKLSFYNSKEKGKGILLIFVYYGNHEEAHQIIEPFVKLGRRVQMLVETMTVLQVNRWIQDAHPDYEHYKSSGRFVKNKLDISKMNTLLDTIEERAEGAVYTAVSCYGMGGNMLSHNKEETSFYYRDSLYILGFQTVWEDNKYSETNRNWFVKRFKGIEKLTDGSFVNFPAGEVEDYQKAYYGENRIRLGEIREAYDPHSLFKFEQSL